MRILLVISFIIFLIACGADVGREEIGNSPSSPSNHSPSSSSNLSSSSGLSCQNSQSGQETKCYTVTADNGKSCNIMIREPNGNGSYSSYTLECPRGTKISCIRTYDNVDFILRYKNDYGSYGLLGSDGYGSGTIFCPSSEFKSIYRVSLHENTCN
jgi:hypothetical protein